MTYIARSDDLLSSPRGLRTLTEGSAFGSCFFYTISSSPGISSLAACSRVEEAAVTSLIQLHMAEQYITSTIKIHVHFYRHLLLLAHLATECVQHSLPTVSPAPSEVLLTALRLPLSWSTATADRSADVWLVSVSITQRNSSLFTHRCFYLSEELRERINSSLPNTTL